jgi:hypothetical protein
MVYYNYVELSLVSILHQVLNVTLVAGARQPRNDQEDWSVNISGGLWRRFTKAVAQERKYGLTTIAVFKKFSLSILEPLLTCHCRIELFSQSNQECLSMTSVKSRQQRGSKHMTLDSFSSQLYLLTFRGILIMDD